MAYMDSPALEFRSGAFMECCPFPPSITSSLNFRRPWRGYARCLLRECPFRCHRDDLHPPTLHPMNGADLFQKLERIGHAGAFCPRDVAEVGGGLGAFVGLPAEVAQIVQRIDRLPRPVRLSSLPQRGVPSRRPDIGMRWTRCPPRKSNSSCCAADRSLAIFAA